VDGPRHAPALLIFWAAIAICGYIIFAVSIRYLRQDFTIFEICTFRSIGGLMFSSILALRQPDVAHELGMIRPGFHAARSALLIIGTLAIVWSITAVPLGVVSALEFTGPLYAAGITFLLSHAVPSRYSSAGLATIAAAACVLCWWHATSIGVALLMPVFATVVLTCTNMMMSRLAARHKTVTILFVMNMMQLPVYLVMAVATGLSGFDSLSSPATALAVAGIASSGIITQSALANATRCGTDLQVSALDTLRIPAVATAAYLIFAETLDPVTISAIALIMAGVIAVTYGARRRRAGA